MSICTDRFLPANTCDTDKQLTAKPAATERNVKGVRYNFFNSKSRVDMQKEIEPSGLGTSL